MQNLTETEKNELLKMWKEIGKEDCLRAQDVEKLVDRGQMRAAYDLAKNMTGGIR